MTPGRNDPCPCGSGKRYKHCCGQLARAVAPTAPATAQDSTVAGGAAQSEFSSIAALLQSGQYAQAEQRARDLAARLPDSGVAWKALGVALNLQRKDALSVMQRAAELLPEDAEAHANLGTALLGTGHYAEAIATLQRSLRIRPDDADTLSNLGNALRATGQREAALANYQAAVKLQPARAELHQNLGNMLLSLSLPELAAESYRRALELRPELADVHNSLAVALLSIGRPGEAMMHSTRATELAPESAAAHGTLGNALIDLGRSEEAATAYRTALMLQSESADLLSNLAIALRLQGRTDEAIDHACRALQLNPRSVPTLVVLADAHADRGEFSQAETRLREAIAIEADSPQAWAGLAHLRVMTPSDENWLAQALRIAGQENLPPRMEILLRYALGKYFNDLKQYDLAFRHYQRANELSKHNWVSYDRAQSQRQTDRLVRGFDSQWLQRVRTQGIASSLPVFILGMPRSGTSLVEQILASHPGVFGAGELPFWNAAAAAGGWLTADGVPEAEAIHRLGVDCLASMRSLAANASRVVDKMPENFRHLGLIHAALPQARIIHVYRNPVDTCLSIYFQNFQATVAYATDLENLAHYYRQYQRLMRHWRALVPGHAILEVSYEALVADPPLWSRKLFEFVGLPWDARSIESQAVRRSVVTASKWQVRQKISLTSVARWRNYATHLAPLLPLLED